MHGVIIKDRYIKHEDENQKLKIGGGSWSVNLKEINGQVKWIIFETKTTWYRIALMDAIKYGFQRTLGGEEKLVVPLKRWETLEKKELADGINGRR